MVPKFVAVPSEAFIKEGQMVRLDCRVSGRPYPDVVWYRNGAEVTDDWTHKVRCSVNHDAEIVNVEPEHGDGAETRGKALKELL